MRQPISHLAASVALICAELLAAVKDAWLSTKPGSAGRYRPEAHYMRGPGPKWRAKHAPISATRLAQR